MAQTRGWFFLKVISHDFSVRIMWDFPPIAIFRPRPDPVPILPDRPVTALRGHSGPRSVLSGIYALLQQRNSKSRAMRNNRIEAFLEADLVWFGALASGASVATVWQERMALAAVHLHTAKIEEASIGIVGPYPWLRRSTFWCAGTGFGLHRRCLFQRISLR